MKDYSLSNKERKEFILNYKIVNTKIFINYANGKVGNIPYTVENEKMILEKMKLQILKSKSFFNTLQDKYKICLKLLIDEILLLGCFLFVIFNFKVSLMTNVIGLIVLPITSLITIYKFTEYKKIKDDIKKQYLFINNERGLNYIIRSNSEVTEMINNEVKEKLLSNNKFSFTINSIDKISYKELEDVYDNIKQPKYRNKVKTLTKKKDRI